MSDSAAPLLSLVVPCFNEADNIDPLRRRLESVLGELAGGDYEIVLVDDGSRDETVAQIRRWQADNPRVRLLALARNFGKEAALTCGLHFSAGRAVVVMDADLQHPPELIPEMLERWRQDFDVVLARRRSRAAEGWFKRTSARGFYRLMGRLAEPAVPPDVGDFRLMDRRVVEAIGHLPERTRFMKGLMNLVGFRHAFVEYDQPGRSAGSTRLTPWRLWNFALDGITSFSTVPLRVWSYLGTVIAVLSMAYAAWIVLRTLIWGIDVPGFASLITLILFFSGLQLISIGILGEYLGRVLIETKDRPLYVIERAEGFEPEWMERRRGEIVGNIVLPRPPGRSEASVDDS